MMKIGWGSIQGVMCWVWNGSRHARRIGIRRLRYRRGCRKMLLFIELIYAGIQLSSVSGGHLCPGGTHSISLAIESQTISETSLSLSFNSSLIMLQGSLWLEMFVIRRYIIHYVCAIELRLKGDLVDILNFLKRLLW